METITKTELKKNIEKELDEYIKKNAFFFYNKEEIEKIALETGFVENHSKLTGHIFLSIFVFAMSIYGNPTLAQLSGLLQTYLKDFSISREAIHKRINEKAVSFFEKILGLAIEMNIPDNLKLKTHDGFNRILILDSTAFQLPKELAEFFEGKGGSASQAGVKIQFFYDLKSSYWDYVLQSGTASDRNYEIQKIVDENTQEIKQPFIEKLQKDDLIIQDLGYFNIETFEAIKNARAFYLSRLLSNAPVYQKDENEKFVALDMMAYIRQLTDHRTEIPVFLKNKNNLYTETRLIIESSPEQVVNQRLRKLNKECKSRGKQPSDCQILFSTVSVYISNAPKELLASLCFRMLYAIRWQIELVFKSWKSNFSIQKMRGKRLERFKCTLYAKLIFICISSRITMLAKGYLWLSCGREVSDYKAAKHFKVIANLWLFAIYQLSFSQVVSLLSNAFNFICKYCFKIKQKSRTYPLQVLEIVYVASKS